MGIRINPDVQSDTHEKITTGSLENKFGISVNETLEIFNKTKEFSSLSITAIAFHIGSNIKDLSPFKNSFEVAKNLIDKIQLNYNSLKTIDVGGGISPEERNFSFKDYYDMLISYFDKERFNFIFEPGRLIAADAGILVSKVLYTKISEGKKFIIIDAGMNDMMRPALYDAQHEILTSKLNDSDHNIETEIVGPICESSDKFMRTTKFANIEEGDNVVIKNVGAYGSTMSSNYNARPFIEEILINKDEIQIIRKKQSFDDFIKNEL
jgi:diaminopimelate decarboxylase